MSKSALITSGWLAVVYAVVYIPLAILAFNAHNLVGNAGGRLIQAIITAILVFFSVTLLRRLKHLLNTVFNFHNTDYLVRWIVAANLAYIPVELLLLLLPHVHDLAQCISVGILVVLGVLVVVFSIKLLTVQDDLFGFLKPYAYTYMASCVMVASIILSPLGILAGVANTIILAMIFFKAAEQSHAIS